MSARTIRDYKHMQAAEVERNAAIALYGEPDTIKRIMHYDTKYLRESIRP